MPKSRSWHMTFMGAMGVALFFFTGLSFALIGPADEARRAGPAARAAAPQAPACEERSPEALASSSAPGEPIRGPTCRADQPACYFDPEAAAANHS